MAGSVFGDSKKKPDPEMVDEALSDTVKFWLDIKYFIQTHHGEFIEEWKFYNPKSGWLLKVLHKKRNLFFFVPMEGMFRLSFIFGDRAVAEIEKSNLPEDLKNNLRTARKYAEGRGLQMEVTSSAVIEQIKELIRIKIRN